MLLETHNFEFGEFLLDAKEKVLLRHGKPLSITPKGFQLLLVLVENHGHLVEKDELMKSVWVDSFVEEGNITFTIGLLRKLLGDDTKNSSFIETVPKRGYRFIADVRRVEAEKKDAPESFVASEITKPQISSNPHFAVKRRGNVIAVAEWQNETDKNFVEEQEEKLLNENAAALWQATNGDANKQTAETQHGFSPQIRRHKSLGAFALVVLLVGSTALGYYLFSVGKTTVGDKKSIAVLPLKPINTTNRDEIYEIGIADSLILQLSSMKGFIVRPLSATRKYADIAQDSLAAGREQQVDFVLASNYQLSGGKTKVTAQLFNVGNGQIEETYKSEKDADDVFAMQDAVAVEFGNKLLARFATVSSSPSAKRGTANEEAYRLYLQGKNLTYSATAENSRKGIEYFEQAIRLDPNFARAYAAMAHAYAASGMLRHNFPREEFEKAKQAVTKALELDPNLGEGYAVSGQLKFYYEWNYPAAEKDLLRALELEPNSDLTHREFATFLAARGRFDEAIAESNIALEIDPNSIFVQGYRGRILYLARRYDEAISQFKQIFEVNEKFDLGWLWTAYQLEGDDAAAYEWFIKSQKARNPDRLELYQNAYKTAGWRGVRLKHLEFEKLKDQKPSANYYAMARQCALVGDKEQAFEYLNKAVEKRQGQMFQLNVEPPFDILRDDVRFDELVKRVGLK